VGTLYYESSEVCCKSKVGAGKVDFEGEVKVSLKVLERRSFCLG
jgi:hypothetical protein